MEKKRICFVCAGNIVRSPLAECGLSKAELRQLAQAWQLPTWDKPATPCLSSRIAYGEEVTPERLAMIDRAERFLREHGFQPRQERPDTVLLLVDGDDHAQVDMQMVGHIGQILPYLLSREPSGRTRCPGSIARRRAACRRHVFSK